MKRDRTISPLILCVVMIALVARAYAPPWLTNSAPANAVSAATPALSNRDPASGIIFYVESDGHHVVALDTDGKVLWRRTPATDGNLPSYSSARPMLNPGITYMGPNNRGSAKSIGIAFGIQFGTLDIKTGDFTFGGQD